MATSRAAPKIHFHKFLWAGGEEPNRGPAVVSGTPLQEAEMHSFRARILAYTKFSTFFIVLRSFWIFSCSSVIA
jgi:hypothetical protein